MVGILPVACLIALSVAAGEPLGLRSLQLHEARADIPSGYTLIAPASPDTVLSLRIALAQSDINELVDVLYDVSDPESPNYGQYLTKAEVETYVRPKQETINAVNAWLSEYNLKAVPLSPAGDWISVDIPVRQANDMFDADYSIFTHESTGSQTIRTLSYSIPIDLTAHVDLVHPAITFPVHVYSDRAPAFIASVPSRELLTRALDTTVNQVCGNGSYPHPDPAYLQYYYGIPSAPANGPGSTVTVAGYDNQYTNAADLEAFLRQYRPDMDPSTTFATQTLNGAVNLQNVTAGSEGNLDIQYTVGLATDVPVTYLLVGNDTQDGIFGYLDTVNYLLGETSPPQVLTTSYSANEDEVSEKLATNLCNAYAQLGARGVSILFSSGDGGVSGTGFSECTTFVPTFPNDCPYVTSVGATALNINATAEVGVPFSGGGFSNYFPTPAYQTTRHHRRGALQPLGRGFPDVAGLGVHYATIVGGEYQAATGTSCSTPMWASVVALLNAELAAAGQPALGFLNPWLYSRAAWALTDVVEGNNKECTGGNGSATGFVAASGWDPITGLGTPVYDKLRTAAGLLV